VLLDSNLISQCVLGVPQVTGVMWWECRSQDCCCMSESAADLWTSWQVYWSDVMQAWTGELSQYSIHTLLRLLSFTSFL